MRMLKPLGYWILSLNKVHSSMGMHFSILSWMVDIAEASAMCQVWNEYSVNAMSYLLCVMTQMTYISNDAVDRSIVSVQYLTFKQTLTLKLSN